jgi:hypothetical protein
MSRAFKDANRTASIKVSGEKYAASEPPAKVEMKIF